MIFNMNEKNGELCGSLVGILIVLGVCRFFEWTDCRCIQFLVGLTVFKLAFGLMQDVIIKHNK